MQQQSKGIPSLPGITRPTNLRSVEPASTDFEMRQRKLLSRGLAAGAIIFLIAGVAANVAFLVIGFFLTFGALVACMKPGRTMIFLHETPEADIPGTIAYELKWGKPSNPFPPHSS
ncbi:hypothetical protein [Paenirhodobacter populi]|uniref:Uncharacterized protein n=1 Tax=Paenirhodobacter populi TaxID=2306993 RepID=A0A443JR05_9RHOB|nr:hypothetical protein [Sinirhodobacter populi]RWR22945.1 hypothetical protein D2T30_04775 [Sinirhodobacter populi]